MSFCPDCGKEIYENQKFCTNCGAKIIEVVDVQEEQEKNKINKKAKIIIASLCFFVLSFTLISLKFEYISESFNYIIKNSTIKIKKQKTPSEILSEISKYQSLYFDLVKRNNALLDIFGDDEAQQDLRNLSSLYKEVENKINPNNSFYQEYKRIEKKYKDVPEGTTIYLNALSAQHYKEIDKLLNDVYKAVKTKLLEDDFNQLKINQRAWLKEVMNYNKVFEEQNFGSIGSLIKANYEADMRSFRALLLIFYLSDNNDSITTSKSYKSLIELDSYQIKNISSQLALNTMITQDEDMEDYIKNTKRENINDIFSIFYKNILALSTKINVDDLDLVFDEKISDYRLNSDTKIIEFEVNNVSAVWLNDSYIENKYSKYLNTTWKEYLKISANSKIINIELGMLASSIDIAKEIISLQSFLKKNPDFILKRQIQNKITFLSSNLIFRDDIDYTFDEESRLSKEAKDGYEYFIKKADKSTTEYASIKKCYEELKQNNLILTANFYKYLFEYTNDKWHYELYINTLNED